MTPTDTASPHQLAPPVDRLRAELGLKPPSRFVRAFPKSLQGFASNGRAMVGMVVLLVLLLTSALAPVLASHDPYRRSGPPRQPPSVEHVLGTTRLGKDVYSQMLYGGRVSLTVGFVAGIVATLIGIVIGICCGYYGGRVDEILTFFVNVALVLPALPLIIVIAAYLEHASPVIIGLVLAATGWGWSARSIRSQTLALRNREFVLAAELMGEAKWRILLVEILPNMLSFLVGGFVLATIYSILAEAGLEFIGLGDPNSVTWGTMLYSAQKSLALETGAWWEIWPPCLAIILTGAALVMINFAVDEMTSPRLRAGRNIKAVRRFLTARGRDCDVF
nr:ABC transporter permease [uncultured Gellertiella sp.]